MYKQLTSEQRYTISVLLQNRTKQKEIAKAINVSPSTVSREIRRNSGVRGRYNWETAQANAVQTKRRKPGNRSIDKDVMERQSIFLLPSNGLRNKYPVYWPRTASILAMRPYIVWYVRTRQKEEHYINTVVTSWSVAPDLLVAVAYPYPIRTSISERPAEIDGKRFGDFEMDTIVGRGNHGAIVTLIERSTSMLFMRKLKKGKNAKELARTVIHLLSPFKEHVKSITTDNGTEFACHEW